MQIREQGKKIQCIRSTYDPTTKRCRQKLVASLDRWMITAEPQFLEEQVMALTALTPPEIGQMLAWAAAKREARRKAQNLMLHRVLAASLRKDAAVLAEVTLTDEQGRDIREAFTVLDQALKAKGF